MRSSFPYFILAAILLHGFLLLGAALTVPSEPTRTLAQKVLRSLQARVLRAPQKGQGIAIVVEVRSRYQLPSGAEKSVRPRGAGAEFDLSDLGATPTHNVAVRVLSERRL